MQLSRETVVSVRMHGTDSRQLRKRLVDGTNRNLFALRLQVTMERVLGLTAGSEDVVLPLNYYKERR